MAINNVIHKIGFKSKKYIYYGSTITVDRTTTTVDTELVTVDKTHEKIIL